LKLAPRPQAPTTPMRMGLLLSGFGLFLLILVHSLVVFLSDRTICPIGSPRLRMTRAGTPTATENGGIGFTTTDPDPMTAPSPMSADWSSRSSGGRELKASVKKRVMVPPR